MISHAGHTRYDVITTAIHVAAYGAIVGSFVIGIVATVSTLWLPVELQNAWALIVLILVLLVRPQGILGRRERIG